MADGAIMRSEYLNVSTGTVRGGPTGHGESLTDVEGYLLPMERARGAGLHSWGVIGGLTVSSVAGGPGLTVTPGSALDAAGRTILLAARRRGDHGPDGRPDRHREHPHGAGFHGRRAPSHCRRRP